MSATVKKELKTIPTYIPGEPSKLPMFFENKPYQGASGRIYPIPYSDSISDSKSDVEYEVYTLENEYIKTEVLPKIGGKILSGYDKTGKYDFIYHNEVVKPALIGLAGPWISGGIEFNYPQHHRPTTYMPLEAITEESENGEKTVWMGEVEPMNRLKGMVGVSIEPARSYIKAKVRIYNRTPQKQLFMWWANLAVSVNENYQTIFPPDVEWVNDHDRRCVMSWPIAKGVYHTARPFNYGEGTDISMYSAVKVPSSFLISQGQSDMDFVAGYDHGKKLGIATVADHTISPGKKMWHWGKGDFGAMWCSNLTDENGPYIELMTGVYTDNQPDFTWINPYETREFEQYWYPIRDIGGVKNATIDGAVNLEVRNDKLFFGFNTTGEFNSCTINISSNGNIIFTDKANLKPDTSYTNEIELSNEVNSDDLYISLSDESGRILVDYKSYKKGSKKPITPRKPVARPCEIKTVEELYINGLHLEQYKQHNYRAQDYYLEGLQRDNLDIGCNTGMARISLRNGDFEGCISYASKAIERLTLRNMHPTNTEPIYLKGIALKQLGKNKESFDILSMACWDYSTRCAAELARAQICCQEENYSYALECLDNAIMLNSKNTKALVIKSIVKRKLGFDNEAKQILERARETDPLDMLSAVESIHHENSYEDLIKTFGSKAENFLDVAYDYISCGFYNDAIFALELTNISYPMIDYVKSYCYDKLNDTNSAIDFIKKAENQDNGYCFPSRIEDITILENAITLNPIGAEAHYYLGCLFYDKFAYEKAIELWEKTIELCPTHAKAYRNLALGYFDKRKDFLSAKLCLEKALELCDNEPRLIFEYQQLLKNMSYSPSYRLDVYNKYRALADKRDDCYLDEITLKSMTGNLAEAIEMAKRRTFHIYEGGEGKLTKQHAWTHVLRGLELYESGDINGAVKAYEDGINMPKSYGEAKTFFNQEAHIHYFLGLISNNKKSFEEAAVYKAAVSEISLFRALALRKLLSFSQAKDVLDEMLSGAESMLSNADRRTYYGVGSPSPMPFELDIVKANLTDGHILKAYALLGLGRFNEAEKEINKATEITPYDFRIYAYRKIEGYVKA